MPRTKQAARKNGGKEGKANLVNTTADGLADLLSRKLLIDNSRRELIAERRVQRDRARIARRKELKAPGGVSSGLTNRQCRKLEKAERRAKTQHKVCGAALEPRLTKQAARRAFAGAQGLTKTQHRKLKKAERLTQTQQELFRDGMPEHYAATILETNDHYYSVTSQGRQFPVFPKQLETSSEAELLENGQGDTMMVQDDDNTDVDGGVALHGLSDAGPLASESIGSSTFQFNLPIRALPSLGHHDLKD